MSSAKSTVNVKIDADVKKTASTLLSRMGIDQTTAIEMFYRKIIAVQALPFLPEPIPSNGQKLLSAITRRSISHKAVNVDAQGHIIIDKDEDPELYDWAING
ncbi:MAG: type II toxin-antitoxin system RelB/DinJ family antitoxin [Oscillospiraceae bacterium]|nr:type II toxin-antitoxin system RelB/DinJ family antitoxin [Oscillospiraceae bacterium]